MNNILVKILNLMRAIETATPEWPELDYLEERVFHNLAILWHTNQQWTVLEIINSMTNVASSGTIHTKLQSLVKKGLVKSVTDSADRRIKYMVPTELSIEYFNKIDQGFQYE